MNRKTADHDALYRVNEMLDAAWEGLEKPLRRSPEARGFPGFTLRRATRVLPPLIADPDRTADGIGLDELSPWIRNELSPWLRHGQRRAERLARERVAVRLDTILQELLRDACKGESPGADAVPHCTGNEIRLAIAIIALDFLHTAGAETSFRIADIEETLSLWQGRIGVVADSVDEDGASLPFRRLVMLAKNLSGQGRVDEDPSVHEMILRRPTASR